jgi:hypothetical protein
VVENWYFPLNKLHEEEKQKMDVEGDTSVNHMKTIEFIVMVGFHHKVGS